LNEERDFIAVAPSVLSADFSRLGEDIAAAEEAGADCFHLDIMDGVFVENLTFGPMIVEAIAKLTNLPLISHLMIVNPLSHVEKFARAGSSLVSFHFEACDGGHGKVIDAIRSAGSLAGIAINPDTPLSAVEHLLADVDCLVVMTVFPGCGGQAFIPEVLCKIEEAVRFRDERGIRFAIEVDGGIKPSNARQVIDAGGQILVAGTAVFRSEDYARAISGLRSPAVAMD
jgi:ribulose-phosphate 3-epimerase